MTKSEMVEQLSLKIRGLSKTEIEVIVDTLFNKMVDVLKDDGRVEVRGFGTFEVRHRHSRPGRNPKTGASVYVKNRRVPFFKVGKELKDRVNQGKSNSNRSVSDIADQNVSTNTL